MLFLVLGAASIFGPATMDINLPALPAVADDLSASVSATQLTVTSYLIGLALGQLVFGALSDAFGRRRPFVVGLFLYAVASLACALAPSMAALVVLRLVQGLGSAAGVVTVRAIVRDMYGGERAAAYLSRLILMIGLAPVLAPSIGAQILAVSSWRGIFVALGVFALATLAATALVIPETLPRSARRPAQLGAMGAAFGELLRHRQFRGYALASGLASAVMVTMITGSTFVLQDDFGFSPRQFGLLFGASAVALIAVAQLNVALVRHVDPRTAVIVSISVNAAAALGLIVFSLVGAGGAVPMCAALMLALATWGLIAANTTALGLSEQSHMAGSASALLGLSQFGMAAAIAPLAGIGGASMLSIGIVVLLCSLGALAALVGLTLRRVRPTAAGSEETIGTQFATAGLGE